jgi:putative transposase
VLKAHDIAISMDGRGHWTTFVERLWRSVKHEGVYLKGYATLPQLLLGLAEYFMFYNTGKNALITGPQHPGCSLPDSRRWRSKHCG